ncbi:DUF6538 domain-containing protein [Variovorax sp. YR566]|uniref:DUF6538 domain-containing protein n=1 Tax=Variovorax sp. YR566 TaxID=3450237 RepID=UPI003F7F975E
MIRTVEKNVSLPTGVAKRGSNYHLQIKVPTRLKPVIKRDFWIRTSLGTGDKSTAAALAHRHWAEATAAFATAEARLKPREVVPLTPAISAYVIAEAKREAPLFDDALRFSPGVLSEWLRAVEPHPIRFLTSPGDGPLPEPEYMMPSEDGYLTPAQVQRLRTIAQLSIEDLGRSVSIGRLDPAKKFAENACASLGVVVDWNTPVARPTLVSVLREMLTSWLGVAGRNDGNPTETPPAPESPLKAPSLQKAPKGKTLQEVFDAWKTGKKPDAVGKTKRAVALVEASGVTGNLRDLTRQDGLTFRDHINTAMTGTSGKTRSDVLASVQALLNYAVKEKGWIEANPWAGTAIPKGRAQKRETWDNDALEILLTAPLTHDRRVDVAAQYWLPLLALMSGARQAELCQLRVADVIRRDGVWLLDINENDEGKSVKSAAGERWVAVHQKLIDLGFVEHVDRMRQAGESLVFPGILTSESRAASVYVSDWFRTRCTALGLYQRYRDFHALRTTVGTALRAVDPPLGEALITATMGHEAGNVGAANYHRPAPKTLRRVIAHLDFPSVLSLPRVYPASP